MFQVLDRGEYEVTCILNHGCVLVETERERKENFDKRCRVEFQ